MTIELVNSMIASVGFPIACVIALAWFVWNIWKQQQESNKEQIQACRDYNKAREEKYCQQIDKFNETLDNFNATLIKIDARLENVEKKLE